MGRHLDAADVLGEVHPRLDLGERIEQARGDRAQTRRPLARELRQRERARRGGLGRDQVGDRFGLGEIDAAGQERAQAELARTGETRARGDQCLEHALGREPAAVARQLDHIFSGVGTRRAEHAGHDLVQTAPGRVSVRCRSRAGFVQPGSGLPGPAVVQGVRRGGGEGAGAAKHAVRDRERRGTAHAHDRETRGAGRGADRGDRFVHVHTHIRSSPEGPWVQEFGTVVQAPGVRAGGAGAAHGVP